MLRKHLRLMVMGGVVVAALATGSTVASTQQRSGLPAVESQLDALQQQVAALIANQGGGVQDPTEPHLAVLRGTISPGSGVPYVLSGSGFTVTSPTTVFCGTNPYPTYQVTFAPGTFSAPPSVVVSAHDFVQSPGPNADINRPVYTVAIDNSMNLGQFQGGITTNGFTARIKTDAFGVTCYGSYNWDFIAIGPH